MSLEKDLVELGKTALGEPTIFCAHCHLPADRGQTLNADDTVSYILACPAPQTGGFVTLGSWTSEQQMALEIGEYIEGKVRASGAQKSKSA
jgi:hypothetical protein